MTQAITMKDGGAALMEKVLLGGDLSKLTSAERLSFYKATCESLGLNPLTKPFDYITLNGKLTLYARKDATEQLRNIHGVSVIRLEREVSEGVYVVTAYLKSMQTGREDSSIGAVNIEGLKGEARANAMMKAETKAKRRGTLSICGLGILDETEIETIPDAKPFVEPAGGIFTGAPTGIPYGALKPGKEVTFRSETATDIRNRQQADAAELSKLQPTLPEDLEMNLAKSCLIEVMKNDCFTDEDRVLCDLWLKKPRSLQVVKKKFRDKEEWVKAWRKETATASEENQDADPLVPGTNSSQEAF